MTSKVWYVTQLRNTGYGGGKVHCFALYVHQQGRTDAGNLQIAGDRRMLAVCI